MTRSLQALAAGVALAALAGCGANTTPAPVLFNEPSAIAVFRGVTIKSGLDPTGTAPYPYHPYIAVSNAGSDEITLFDAVDDTQVLSPVLVRDLAYPVPGRPTFLVSADLGDDKPDLLAVVATGDVPNGGGSHLLLIRTWGADGGIVGTATSRTPYPVELGADVVALLPMDPVGPPTTTRVDPPGTARLVAALAGERIALVSFQRSPAGDGTGIDPSQATTLVSAPLGFQPAALAVVPGDPNHVYAATRDPLPGGVFGVAEIDITAPVDGAAWPVRALDARAPTRLVAAASLAEADLLTRLDSGVATSWDQSAFTTTTPAARVYAVLDESRCGLQWPIACGLVAIDVAAGGLPPDPQGVDPAMQAPFRAPIQIPNIRALATSRPPVAPPSPPGQGPEPQYAGSYMAIATAQGAPATTLGFRQTTAAAGVASADGLLTFLDLGRWDLPSDQPVRPAVTTSLTVVPSRPAGTPGVQWIVLRDAGGGIVNHADKFGLAAATGVTPGYTPSDTWSVVREGMLPKLQGLAAEPGYDGTTSIALQQSFLDPSGSGSLLVSSAVRVYDPTLGVHEGDTVVLEPTGLSTCGAFEATVSALMPPDAAHPGGYVRIAHRVVAPTPQVPAKTIAGWAGCVDLVPGSRGPSAPSFIATFRAGDYVLLRGTGTAATHVGRPLLDTPFSVQWQDEATLATTCLLPPAVQWDARWGQGGHPAPSCDEGSACRSACEQLLNARLARRLFYLSESKTDGRTVPSTTGPALQFTLALELEVSTQPVYRDMALTFNTSDGRVPFRQGVSFGAALDPRAVLPWDRSRWDPTGLAGVRFIVPYAGGVVLDATPNLELSYGAFTIH